MKCGGLWWECKNPSRNMWNAGNQGVDAGNGVGMPPIRVELPGKLGKNVVKGEEMKHTRSEEG